VITYQDLLRQEFDNGIAIQAAELFRAVRIAVEEAHAEPDPTRVIAGIAATVEGASRQYIEDINVICERYRQDAR